MMRGTVYVITPRELMRDEVITRQVFESDDATTDDFRMTAANYYVHDSPLQRGCRVEFGPIGPPWGLRGD